VDQPANAERVRCGRCEAGNGGPSATAKAAADWGGGRVQCGDIAAQRTMLKRTFPKLTLRYSQGRPDYPAERIMLDGLADVAA
jgi:hypothetical protein